jgi:hypothetical protein
VHRFDVFFLASSVICVGFQVKRFLFRWSQSLGFMVLLA